jgi:WD40 repeat protein
MSRRRIYHLIIPLLLINLLVTSCSIDGIFSETAQKPTNTNPPTETVRLLPDLEIVQISPEMDDEKVCDSNQDRIRILVTIQNSGKAASGAFSVRVNDYEQVVKNKLAVGEQTSLWFPGNDFASVQIDVSEEVDESDEKNNSIIQDFDIPNHPPRCFQTPTPQLSILKPTHTMAGHTAEVLSLDFSPDGNLIASGSIDNTMRIWDVREARLLRTMHGHPFPILTLMFSPNGSFLITGSTDSIGRVWRVSNGNLIGKLEGHAGWLNSLDISSDGAFIATCADDYTVRIWRFLDTKLIQTIDEGMSIVSQVAFTLDDNELAWSESNGNVRVWSLEGRWSHLLNNSKNSATSIAVAPVGDMLVSGHSDGSLEIWDLGSEELLYELSGHTNPVTSLSFSPDGKWLVSGSTDGRPRVWEFSAVGSIPRAIYILDGHEGPVNSVSFSPDGSLIASGSDDHTIRLWTLPGN